MTAVAAASEPSSTATGIQPGRMPCTRLAASGLGVPGPPVDPVGALVMEAISWPP